MNRKSRILLAGGLLVLAALLTVMLILLFAGRKDARRSVSSEPAATTSSVAPTTAPTTAAPPSAAQTTAAAQYLLGEWQGKLAVYTLPRTDAPTRVYDIFLSSLPDEEQQRLKKGVAVDGDTQLKRLLEDYTS